MRNEKFHFKEKDIRNFDINYAEDISNLARARKINARELSDGLYNAYLVHNNGMETGIELIVGGQIISACISSAYYYNGGLENVYVTPASKLEEFSWGAD